MPYVVPDRKRLCRMKINSHFLYRCGTFIGHQYSLCGKNVQGCILLNLKEGLQYETKCSITAIIVFRKMDCFLQIYVPLMKSL